MCKIYIILTYQPSSQIRIIINAFKSIITYQFLLNQSFGSFSKPLVMQINWPLQFSKGWNNLHRILVLAQTKTSENLLMLDIVSLFLGPVCMWLSCQWKSEHHRIITCMKNNWFPNLHQRVSRKDKNPHLGMMAENGLRRQTTVVREMWTHIRVSYEAPSRNFMYFAKINDKQFWQWFLSD